MKPQKIFPFLLAVGLFLLVLGLLLLFRYAQARGSMMVLAFVFVGAGCTVCLRLLRLQIASDRAAFSVERCGSRLLCSPIP